VAVFTQMTITGAAMGTGQQQAIISYLGVQTAAKPWASPWFHLPLYTWLLGDLFKVVTLFVPSVSRHLQRAIHLICQTLISWWGYSASSASTTERGQLPGLNKMP